MKYKVTVRLAGRKGEQIEPLGNKRAAIRRCRALVKEGGFGSAGEVRDTEEKRGQLIYQCHAGKSRSGATTLIVDEL